MLEESSLRQGRPGLDRRNVDVRDLAGEGDPEAAGVREDDGGSLPRFLLLYAALYAGYGALSPFLPAFLKARGLAPEEIAALLAAAMLVRLAAGPLVGRLADARGMGRGLLASFLAAAAVLDLIFLAGSDFPALLLLALAQAVATAPLAPLADALALATAARGRGFEYGSVRGAGSAAFIAATALTGSLVDAFGAGAGLWACTVLFGLGSVAALRLPSSEIRPDGEAEARDGFRALLAIAAFRRLVLAAALVIGAHALHDAFAVIAWQEAGIGPRAAGLLWSEAVAAEVAVFLWFGPRLLRRIGPDRALALAGLAGGLRWAVQAESTALPVLSAIQALHGLTFALLHLACLRLITDLVPATLRATALTVYGSLGLGLASALVTALAGPLYAGLGRSAFWTMSVLSLAAVPVALAMRRTP